MKRGDRVHVSINGRMLEGTVSYVSNGLVGVALDGLYNGVRFVVRPLHQVSTANEPDYHMAA